MHINIGTWANIKRIPPKVQIIAWWDWKGVRWHRWTGGIGTILFGSLLLGFVELRFWRQPTLHTVVRYPGEDDPTPPVPGDPPPPQE